MRTICGTILAAAMCASAMAESKTSEFMARARAAYATAEYAQYTNTVVTRWSWAKAESNDVPRARFAECRTTNDVRWVNIPYLRNVRDIGGWNGLKPGRAYRGSALYRCKDAPNGISDGTAAALREVGIVTELNLRGVDEAAKSTEHARLSDAGPKEVNVPISSYMSCFGGEWEGMRNALLVFTRPENYPIYFHCAGGADRTGTLAFVLEGICGASESDLVIDYELTTCSGMYGPRLRNADTRLNPIVYKPNRDCILRMLDLVKSYKGETLADKFANCAKHLWRLTDDDIAAIRRELMSANAESVAALDAKGIVVNGEATCEIERRTFPDGEAVRYRLPDGERHIEREETVWTLPTDAKVWYQEYGGDYEKPYSSSLVREIPVGTVVNLPVTAKLADGTYRLITEANVVGYTDSAAKYLGNGRFAVFYANEQQGFTQTAAKGTPLPGTTPWRVMLVAKDIQTLATSDIVRRLCPDPSPEVAAKAAAFVKPGRAVWQWLPAGNPKYEEQKEWFDRTKKLGFEYYLIDAGWRDWQDGDMDQWACLKKWIDYGKSIGVESFIWVHSMELMDPAARRAYLAKVKATGAVGIKIDFHPAAKCAQMAWYEETLADTLEFSLMTDFHGCVKPSGRERTWPHEVAREAIRGHEWHITRYNRVLPPEHDCILPFNRLIQGHADYTPVVFEKKELQGFTWARELAQGVIFSAPFLCFGDYPKNYLENSAVELIKAMPSTYDEVRVLPGSEIGECAAFAKRKDEKWFVAVENGAEDRSLEIPFHFLRYGKWKMKKFADAENSNAEFDVSEFVVVPSDTLKLALRAKGGFVAVIEPELDCVAADMAPGEEASLLPAGKKFKLVWHDEFNGDRLDESKWSYRTNFWGRRAHWFAAPEDNAVEVKDGLLHLKLVKKADGQFVSPQLQTGELVWDVPHEDNPKGFWPLPKREKAKFAHRYGYYECRCRLQQMPGWWSAFWMQTPTQGCSLDPRFAGIEHDIMESFEVGEVIPHYFHANGYGADYLGFCVPRRPKDVTPEAFNGPNSVKLDETQFHVFGMLWEPDGYTFFIDGRQHGPKVGQGEGEAVSQTEEFVLLTTEAKWYRNDRMTGRPVPELDAAAVAGDEFIVDYVRVYDLVR